MDIVETLQRGKKAADYTIKASFKDCSIKDRNSFCTSKCILPISVGQKVHEGKKLTATLNLINRSFKECVILVDDTVQRHTLRINETKLTEEHAYDKALQEGSIWLERNDLILANLTIPYLIIRWNKWLYHPGFKKQKVLIEETYNNDNLYRRAIDFNIEEFLMRLNERDGVCDFKRAQELCLQYLIEECACMCLWIEEGSHFEVYPTGRNKAMAATYEKFIKPFYPDLLRSVSLRFKKYYKKSITEFKHQEKNQVAVEI